MSNRPSLSLDVAQGFHWASTRGGVGGAEGGRRPVGLKVTLARWNVAPMNTCHADCQK